MRRRTPRPLAEAVTGLATTLAPATTLARVQETWREATGAAIAASASPVAEREGVLTVSCATSVWAQELDLMAADLIARLNAALGSERIRELRCRTA